MIAVCQTALGLLICATYDGVTHNGDRFKSDDLVQRNGYKGVIKHYLHRAT